MYAQPQILSVQHSDHEKVDSLVPRLLCVQEPGNEANCQSSPISSMASTSMYSLVFMLFPIPPKVHKMKKRTSK